MKKGDKVLVHAVVYTKFRHVPISAEWRGKIIYEPEGELLSSNRRKRSLKRSELKTPMEALIVGTSVRITGIHHYGGFDDYSDPGSLTKQKHHKVFMVTPLNTQRYIKPYACLEEDLELINV